MDSPIDWIALPQNRAAYAQLSRLLTKGKRRAEKGECKLRFGDLFDHCKDIILIGLPQDNLTDRTLIGHLHKMGESFPGQVFLGTAPRYDGNDQAYFDQCARLARRLATPMVAIGDVLMHKGQRRKLADVLTCMREHITIDEIGRRAQPNGERRLKSATDMVRLFFQTPKRDQAQYGNCGALRFSTG